MDKPLRKFERYLNETLGLDVRVSEVLTEKLNLPYYLQDAFTIYGLQLRGLDCLLAIPRENTEQTPATIKKYMQQIQDKSGREVVYMRESISTYDRKRLIEHKVSFVVPGNQLYLPILGIDFREYLKKVRTKTTKISPATQAVILYALYHDANRSYTPLELSELLDYTPMTMTRALDELEAAGIGEIAVSGKNRLLSFSESKTTIWEKALPVLRSPVKKRVWTGCPRNNWRCVRSGLSALAEYSLLAEPKQPVFAISQNNWKALRQRGEANELPYAEQNSCHMEVWGYDPCTIDGNGIADRLSLYLSLKDDLDERILAALDDMMKGMAW
jgi:DNA-binding MarR family transcriptional regulator